eukprot:GEMP01005874.1.p1 GENE.GEMP01005874.1~~GEMP01005874.1.p1  ORF type:complete len:1039 (+),score=230.37 GEMP01005874.1:57-3173(+)
MSMKKKPPDIAMDDVELRNLKIPVSLPFRGTLSPSKNSFLPTLIEQAQVTLNERKFVKEIVAAPPTTKTTTDEASVLSCFDAKYLPAFQEDFEAAGGSLALQNFVEVMLPRISRTENESGPKSKMADTMALMSIFKHADVHSLGFVTWEAFSSYLIDQGMTKNDDCNVDVIKTYDASSVVDTSKHSSVVEKLLYVEEMDALICISHHSNKFSVYDPKKLTFRQEVSGHRGSVTAGTYCDAMGQFVTTGADLQLCFWDSVSLGLRNRLSSKDVQLCLAYSHTDQGLYSGSVDGTLYRWDLENMCLAEGRKGVHKRAINDILMIYDINFLGTASSDGSILMWDTAQMRPKKTLWGHRKGVYSLAYSTDYHCVLSAGLEQEAFIWNPYVERVPIFRLKGHLQALCAVDVVPGTPQIVTADVGGTFKLWDMRNFRCVQTFGSTDAHDLNTFALINLPGGQIRIAAGTSNIQCFDNSATQGHSEYATDSVHISHTLYNPESGSFYTVAKRSVTEWSAEGAVQTVLRDMVPYEITAAALSENCRKLYIGDVMGNLTSHNLFNGSKLQSFDSHSADVSNIEVWKGTNGWLLSASWDGSLRIHLDSQDVSRPQVKADWMPHCTIHREKHTELRGESTCATIGVKLNLLATGGTDCKVVFYDLKTLKREYTLVGFQNEITCVAFLDQNAIIAIGCQGGTCSMWRVRPYAWQCIAAFENLEGGLHPCAVTSFRFHEQNHLYSCDVKGMIRCWSLETIDFDDQVDPKSLMSKGGMVPTTPCPEEAVDFAQWATDQVQIRRELLKSPSPTLDSTPFVTEVCLTSGTMRGREMRLITEVEGHGGEAATLDMIEEVQTLVTTGGDKKVKIWRAGDLKSLGVLSPRSYKDGLWHFPFDSKLLRTQRIMDEADELMKNLPAIEKRPREVVPAKQELDTVPQSKKGPKWKVGAQSLLDDTATECRDDYLILYDQMEAPAVEMIGDRLIKKAKEKKAATAAQRRNSLTEGEAKAAHRLAVALSAVGSDEFGLYRRMADSLRPKVREIRGVREEEPQ